MNQKNDILDMYLCKNNSLLVNISTRIQGMWKSLCFENFFRIIYFWTDIQTTTISINCGAYLSGDSFFKRELFRASREKVILCVSFFKKYHILLVTITFCYNPFVIRKCESRIPWRRPLIINTIKTNTEIMKLPYYFCYFIIKFHNFVYYIFTIDSSINYEKVL